jgi:hypothetical protein
VKSPIVRIQPGTGVSSPAVGRPRPLLDGQCHEEQAQAKQEHVYPGRGLARLTRVCDAGEHERDRTDRGEVDTAGEDECQPLSSFAPRPEHEHGGDDRHREDRDRDRERQHISYRLAHALPTLTTITKGSYNAANARASPLLRLQGGRKRPGPAS